MAAHGPETAAVQHRRAADDLGEPQGRRTPSATAPTGPAQQEALHPRGAMAATLLYLLVVVAAWGYLYLSLLRAGQGGAP